MKKDLKLNLDDLKVQSFVTTLDYQTSKTIGGAQAASSLEQSCPFVCPWNSHENTSCTPSDIGFCSLIATCLC